MHIQNDAGERGLAVGVLRRWGSLCYGILIKVDNRVCRPELRVSSSRPACLAPRVQLPAQRDVGSRSRVL